jgi:biopolymer transport protein ExbD
MKKRQPQSKKRRTVPVPIASMGDIAFLLIIFFLVCSEVSKDNANIQLLLPESRHVQKDEVTVAARVAIDEEGQIYLDGVKVDSPRDVEWGVRAILANAVTDEQKHVQLKCHADLTKETYEPVIKAIAEADGKLKIVGELE